MEELLGYHYTTTEAFLSMTKKTLEQKDSDNNFEFWASSCLCMNDYVEMKHGYDVLLSLLKEVEDSNGERYRLSDVMIYYLQRIPGHYKGRWEFFGVLYNTSQNPFDLDCYIKISEMLKSLCWGLKYKKKSSLVINNNESLICK